MSLTDWILGLTESKCEFYNKCKLYKNDSPTCNKTGGGYYSDGYCGKFRQLSGWE